MLHPAMVWKILGITMNRYVTSNRVCMGVLPAVIAAILLSSFPASSVEPIAVYNFSDATLAPAYDEPYSTAGNITGGITESHSWGFESEGPFLTLFANSIGSNQTDALTDNKYVSFTIIPKVGIEIEYSSLYYEGYLLNSLPSTAAGTIETRWSLDSFAAPLGTLNMTALGNQNRIDTRQFGLPQTSGSAVEFRIYFYADSNSPNLQIGIDDVFLLATYIHVPEPGSLGLLLLGSGLFALRSPARAARRARMV